MRELGSGNSEGRPSSQPSSQPGSKNEGRLQLPVSSQAGSKNKGSGDSFDPSSAFVVDLPKSDVGSPSLLLHVGRKAHENSDDTGVACGAVQAWLLLP